MTEAILGIQIGTGSVSFCAYDLLGRRLSGAEVPLHIYNPKPGQFELDPAELWESCCAASRQCLRQLGQVRILSIGVASVGESHVVLDRHGEPVSRVMAWYDLRATSQAEAVSRQIGDREMYRTTGQFISPKFGVFKTMWVRDNTPEGFARLNKILTLHDYVIFQLTGQIATEYSMASRMMCFDVEKLCWAKELLRYAGLPDSALPEPTAGGTHIGTVSPAASRATGLLPGIPVYAGGHDHACAAIAVNIFDDNVMMDSMDSAETTMVATENRLDIDQGFQNQIAVYPHFGSKIFRAITSIQAFGTVFHWLARWLSMDSEEGERLVRHSLQLLSSGPSEAELYFIPHLRGLQESAYAKGSFLGIEENCGLQTMLHTVAEGLCFEMRRRYDACENAFDRAFPSIRAVGAYSHYSALMQMKAVIVGSKIETIPHTDAIPYGAALIGALGAGILREADLQDVYRFNAEYLPEFKVMRDYAPRYQRYLHYHSQLLSLYSSTENS